MELFEAALGENIIAYLPTGSRKTYIAALLIKEKVHEVTKPLDLGGKRTVFLVPIILLAIQQAAYLRTSILLFGFVHTLLFAYIIRTSHLFESEGILWKYGCRFLEKRKVISIF